MRMALLLMVFLALVSGGVLAQDMPPTFCGDLSEADCTILTESASSMRDLSSAAFNFQLDFGVSNLPEDAEIDSLSLRLTGDGAYSIDPAALEALSMMQSPATMMENMAQLPAMLENLLTAIAADATLVLYLPQNLPDTDQPLPERVGLSLRLVDGVGYVNLDKLAELDRSGDMPRGWVGIDLVELVNAAMAEMDMSQLPDMADMSAMMNMNMEMMNSFMSPEFMGSYMTVTRAADTTVAGQTAAVFNQTIDLGALYSSPALAEMLTAQMQGMAEAMGEDPSTMNMDEMQEGMAMLGALFDGLVVETSQTIGLDDGYLHSTTASLDWDFDLSRMAGMMGTSASDMPDIEPINFNFNFVGNMSQFNSAPAITAPEDAQIVPLRSLMGRGSF